jgi:uncharacterized membrane protein
MNSRFRCNSLLANTALILLCYIWRVLVILSPRRKLLSGQTHDHIIPELVLPLALPLPEADSCITTKKHLDKVERDIKVMC